VLDVTYVVASGSPISSILISASIKKNKKIIQTEIMQQTVEKGNQVSIPTGGVSFPLMTCDFLAITRAISR